MQDPVDKAIHFIHPSGVDVTVLETKPQSEFATTYGALTVNYGALSELPGEEGLAHLVEHCMVTGGGQKYAGDALKKLNALFGDTNNAFVSPSMTRVYAEPLTSDFSKWLDVASDMLFTPQFPQKVLDEQRNVVIQELSERRSSLKKQHLREYQIALMGEGPYTYDVGGKEEVVAQAQLSDLKRVHSRGIGTANTELIVIGAIPVDLREQMDHAFEHKPVAQPMTYTFKELSPKSEHIVLHRHAPNLLYVAQPELSSAEIRLAIPTVPYEHPDRPALAILGDIFGGSSLSRLFQVLREEKGLSYGAHAYQSTQQRAGFFEVETTVPAKRLEESLDVIFSEMKRLQEMPVEEKELQWLQSIVKRRIASSLSNDSFYANAIETKKMYGISIFHTVEVLDTITSDELQIVAQKYLPSSRDDPNYVALLRNPLLK